MMNRRLTIWLSGLMLGVSLAISGCRGGISLARVDRSEIQSADPAVRIRAIIRATRNKDERAIPLVVDRLEDEDEAVRFVAIESLRQLTGTDRGYRSFDPSHVRAPAVQAWRAWLTNRTGGNDSVRSTTRPSPVDMPEWSAVDGDSKKD